MKKFLLLWSLLLLSASAIMAQEEGDEKIRDKMREYIQQRMRLNTNEAERFTPIFLRYFREWRTTLRENRGDGLVLRQKVIELQIRYRTEFKEVVGERRCNEIYRHQQTFIEELKNVRRDRQQRNPPRRNGSRAITI
ncbi:MAG: hypothetical protein JNM88_16535 [Chitinophagaceae bacterium]|nr:hypothetical protein [Chitinophagaceae bacterium]